MAWKQGRYYYRNRREGRKVRSEYIAAGALAQYAARLDEFERQQLAAEREAWRRQVAEQADIDRQIDDVGEAMRNLVAAALLAAGHHTHRRQWRRERDD